MDVHLADQLTSHQAAREAGRACASAIFGVAGQVFSIAREWATKANRPLAIWRGNGLAGALTAIGKALSDLDTTTATAAAQLLPHEVREPRLAWRNLCEDEQARRLQKTLPPGPYRDVVERLVLFSPVEDSFWSNERCKALLELTPAAAAPLLFAWLEPYEARNLAWCDAFVDFAPRTPVLFAGPPEGRLALEQAALTGERWAVLLREGLIAPTHGEPDGSSESRPAESEAVSEERVGRLVAAEAPDALPLLEEAIADPNRSPVEPGPYDSVAEAFLARMLEAHPWTANLFIAQGRPGFRMRGGHGATVDFLAESLKIALEVDGPHHLESSQYRRDRHKDFELQSRGYIVLRFLAEDVASDFERIREIIHRVVRDRSL